MPADDRTFWIAGSTCSAGDGLSTIGFGSLCLITVILDPEARKHYAGINLVILRHRNLLPNGELVIMRRVDLRYWGMSDMPTNCEIADRQLERYSRKTSHRLMSVILEIHDDQSVMEETIGLRLRPLQLGTSAPLQPTHPTDETAWKIMYETTHLFTPSNSAFVHYLQLNGGFVSDDPLDPDYPSDRKAPGIYSFQAHVLPTTTKRRGFAPILPKSILFKILPKCVDFQSVNWPLHAIRLASVSRAWRDAATEVALLQSGSFNSTPVIFGLARLLQLWPDKSSCVKHLIAECRDVQVCSMWFDATIASIISAATSLQSISLKITTRQQARTIFPQLKVLRKVKDFSLSAWAEALSVRDLQQAISEWEECETLFVQSTRARQQNSQFRCLDVRSDLVEEPDTTTRYPKLRALTLLDFDIYGEALLRFIPAPTPALTEVTLENVGGPTNRELLTFLTKVAHSIRVLTISDSHFELDWYIDEYAIDAAIPRLVQLETARFYNCDLTPLAIERKSRNVNEDGSTRACAITIDNSHFWIQTWERDTIALADAMKVTGWTKIGIEWKSQGNVDVAVRRKVEEVALERNIDLYEIERPSSQW